MASPEAIRRARKGQQHKKQKSSARFMMGRMNEHGHLAKLHNYEPQAGSIHGESGEKSRVAVVDFPNSGDTTPQKLRQASGLPDIPNSPTRQQLIRSLANKLNRDGSVGSSQEIQKKGVEKGTSIMIQGLDQTEATNMYPQDLEMSQYSVLNPAEALTSIKYDYGMAYNALDILTTPEIQGTPQKRGAKGKGINKERDRYLS